MEYVVLKYETYKCSTIKSKGTTEVVDKQYFSEDWEVQEYIERHSNNKTEEGIPYYEDEYITNTFSVIPDN